MGLIAGEGALAMPMGVDSVGNSELGGIRSKEEEAAAKWQLVEKSASLRPVIGGKEEKVLRWRKKGEGQSCKSCRGVSCVSKSKYF